MKTNLKFFHGLGDACQFSIVLAHIEKHRPHWQIGLTSNYPELFPNYKYDPQLPVKPIIFSTGTYFCDAPSTKITRCLLKELNIEPDLLLWKYTVPFPVIAPKENYVLIHATGVSTRNKKDLTPEESQYLVDSVFNNNYDPVVIDYQNEHPYLKRCKRITEKFTVLGCWNLLCGAKALIGIDSGPEHLCCAAPTPVHIIWKKWHPVNNIDPHHNLNNWVCKDSVDNADGKLSWYWDHYNTSFYASVEDCVERICESL